MTIESKAFDNEKVKNTARTFGEVAEDEGYYLVMRIKGDGREVPMMFTEKNFEQAEKTAARNMEDLPEEETSFFRKLFFG